MTPNAGKGDYVLAIAMLCVGAAALIGAAAHPRVVAQTDLVLIAGSWVLMPLAYLHALGNALNRAAAKPLGHGLPITGMTRTMLLATLLIISALALPDVRGQVNEGRPTNAAPVIAGCFAALWLVVLWSQLAQEAKARALAAALVAAPEHEPPRAAAVAYGSASRRALRGLVWRSRLVTLLALAAVVANLVIAAWHPWLPPINMFDGGIYAGS